MGRPRRRRGGGRVTPKRPRPVYRDEFGADLEFLAGEYRYQVQVQLAEDDAEPEFRILVQDAESVVEELASAGAADLDEADFWASCIQSAISTRRSPDGMAAPVFLACAERTGGPAARPAPCWRPRSRPMALQRPDPAPAARCAASGSRARMCPTGLTRWARRRRFGRAGPPTGGASGAGCASTSGAPTAASTRCRSPSTRSGRPWRAASYWSAPVPLAALRHRAPRPRR